MKKVIISIIILICLAIGAYFAAGPFSFKPPAPIITVGEKKLEAVQGSYCWEMLFENVCADTPSPPELIKDQGVEAAVVAPQSEIHIQFKKEPHKNSIGANLWLENGEIAGVQLNDNVIIAPKEEGIYVYDVYASWDQGSSSFAFVIEVR